MKSALSTKWPFVLTALGVLTAIAAARADPPGDGPPVPPTSPATTERFYADWLAGPERQEFSLAKTSAAERFVVTARFKPKATEEDPDPVPVGLLIARDGERVGVLLTAPDGSPYAFMNREFFVMLDPVRPERLRVIPASDGFRLTVRFGMGAGGIEGFCNWDPDAKEHTVRINARELLPPPERVQNLLFDEKRLAVILETPKARATVALDRARTWGAAHAVHSILIRPKDGNGLLEVAGVETDAAPPRDVLAVTLADVRRLKVPVDEARVPVLGPPKYLSGGHATPGASALASLFAPRGRPPADAGSGQARPEPAR